MNLTSLRAFAKSGQKELKNVTMTLNHFDWYMLANEYPDIFRGVTFNNVNFRDSLVEHLNFRDSIWINSYFRGEATRCDFTGSSFDWADFSNARFQDCTFHKCVIEGMRCTGAIFNDVSFQGATISGLYFNDTKYIHNIDLHDTFIEIGVLDGVDLDEFKGVSAVRLNNLDHTVYCIHSTDDSFSRFRIAHEWHPMSYFIENPDHPYTSVVRFLYNNGG